eukprot:3428522-Rhodomonas_salina.1
MQTHDGHQGLYKTPFHAIATIVREEGFKNGLYRGLTLNYIKVHTPALPAPRWPATCYSRPATCYPLSRYCSLTCAACVCSYQTIPNVAIYMSLYDMAKNWLIRRTAAGGPDLTARPPFLEAAASVFGGSATVYGGLGSRGRGRADVWGGNAAVYGGGGAVYGRVAAVYGRVAAVYGRVAAIYGSGAAVYGDGTD